MRQVEGLVGPFDSHKVTNFYDQYGTHFYRKMYFGAKYGKVFAFSSKTDTNSSDFKNKVTVGGEYNGIKGEGSISNSEQAININGQQVTTTSSYNIGQFTSDKSKEGSNYSRNNANIQTAQPIAYDLAPISKLFDGSMPIGNLSPTLMNAANKQQLVNNLEKGLINYCFSSSINPRRSTGGCSNEASYFVTDVYFPEKDNNNDRDQGDLCGGGFEDFSIAGFPSDVVRGDLKYKSGGRLFIYGCQKKENIIQSVDSNGVTIYKDHLDPLTLIGTRDNRPSGYDMCSGDLNHGRVVRQMFSSVGKRQMIHLEG
jgi:hypothetical protein